MTELGVIGGALALVVSLAVFWYFMPRDGKVHRWVIAPYVESALPLAIMTLFVLGLAAIGAAVLPMMLGAE
jgi:hypothetical protein